MLQIQILTASLESIDKLLSFTILCILLLIFILMGEDSDENIILDSNKMQNLEQIFDFDTKFHVDRSKKYAFFLRFISSYTQSTQCNTCLIFFIFF